MKKFTFVSRAEAAAAARLAEEKALPRREDKREVDRFRGRPRAEVSLTELFHH